MEWDKCGVSRAKRTRAGYGGPGHAVSLSAIGATFFNHDRRVLCLCSRSISSPPFLPDTAETLACLLRHTSANFFRSPFVARYNASLFPGPGMECGLRRGAGRAPFPSGNPCNLYGPHSVFFAAAGAKSAPSAAPRGISHRSAAAYKTGRGRVSGSRCSNPGEGGNSGIPPSLFPLRRWQGANTPLRPGEEERRGGPGIGRRRIRRCGASGDFRSACSLPRENIFAPPSTPNKSLFGLVCGHADMEWVILPPCTALCENCFVRQKGLSSLPPSLPPSAHSSCRLDVPVRSYRGEGRRHFLKQLERGGGRGGGGDMGPNREVGVRIEEEEEHHGLRRERSLFFLRGGGRPSPVLHRQKHPHKLRRKEAK